MNKFKKILAVITLLALPFSLATKIVSAQRTASTPFYLSNDTVWLSNDSNYILGSYANKIKAIYVDNLNASTTNITTLTFASVSGDIDMGGFDISNGGTFTAANFTATGTITTTLGTAAGTFLAANALGEIIATSSPVLATGAVSAGAGISVTAGQSIIGSGLTITNDGVTSISATAPLVNNLSTGAISLTCNTASGSQVGCLSSADWTTFNGKLSTYDAWTHPGVGISATTSALALSGTTSTSTIANALGVGTTTPSNTGHKLIVQGSASVYENKPATSSSMTVDLNTGNQQLIGLGAATTITLSNGYIGGAYRLILCQDGTGSRVVTWASAISWAGGTQPTLTTTANKCDVVSLLRTQATSTPTFIGGASLNY